jgi:hypothetical protein
VSSSNLPPGPINPYSAPQAAVSVQHDLERHGFKDRKGGLIAFGIVAIIFGVGCFALAGLMVVSLLAVSAASGVGPDWHTIVPAFLMYGVLAVAFTWLGIGSIRARRWARNLILILTCCWLVIGLAGTAATVTVLPTMLANTAPDGNPLPPAAQLTVLIVSAVFMIIFFIVVPSVFVLFYRSPHVKATCEAYDPKPGWTDACPLPVLALSLLLALGALVMLVAPITMNGVMMFMGTLVSGLPGSMMYLVLGALWLYAGWNVYKVRSAGWWVAMVSYLLFSFSWIYTSLNIDVTEMYARMGYPNEQLEAMRQINLWAGNSFALWLTYFYLPFFVLLVYVKRFFNQK